MKTAQKRDRAAAGRRGTGRKRTGTAPSVGKFLLRTFCYLKGEQFLKASNQLLCEAV